MTRLIHIEAFAGASGDMLLAALLDLGAPVQILDEVIRALDLGPLGVVLRHEQRRGIGGQRLSFVDDEGHPVETSRRPHPLRRWRQIRERVALSGLEARVRDASLGVLQALAEAEAEVHGIDVLDVHFHEIGAVDTLMDVVGFCAALAHLGWPSLSVGPLSVGRGCIDTDHGVLPALAPATALLCQSLPLHGIDVEGESVTPTGAALLKHLATPREVLPAGTLLGVGVGLGQRDPAQRANLLRALLLQARPAPAEAAPEPHIHDERGWIELSTNLDDDDPERCAFVVQRLLDRGAHDAWLTPIVMKKGRAAHTLHALAPAELLAPLSRLILGETSALGLRWHAVQRRVLSRQTLDIETPLGRVRVKRSTRPDGQARDKAEFEDCARLAREHGQSLIEVRELALRAARQQGPS